MTRPLVIDGCCGEGGAGQGYYDAGFDVLGGDTSTARLAHYPFPSQRMDVVEFILEYGPSADLIHVSPPCTGYTRGTTTMPLPERIARYGRLIPAVREACQYVGKPYVIENVEDAKPEMANPLTLCWTEFHAPGSVVDEDGTRLWMRRHRLFESNLPLMGAGGCQHPKGMQCAGAYGGARRDKWEARHIRKGGYVPSADVMRELVGVPWMSEKGCQLAIPPSYARHIGEQALAYIESEVPA